MKLSVLLWISLQQSCTAFVAPSFGCRQVPFTPIFASKNKADNKKVEVEVSPPKDKVDDKQVEVSPPIVEPAVAEAVGEINGTKTNGDSQPQEEDDNVSEQAKFDAAQMRK